MVEASEMQWIQGCGGWPMEDAYTLVLEDGSPVGFLGLRDGLWNGYWYEGTYVGCWAELGLAMDEMEQPAKECSEADCDNPAMMHSPICSTCVEAQAAEFRIMFDAYRGDAA